MIAVGTVEMSGTSFTIGPNPNGLGMLAMSLSADGAGACGGPFAIGMGTSGWNVSGNVYAPNGCVNVGGSDININGSIVSHDMNISISGGGISSTGAGAGNYFLYQ